MYAESADGGERRFRHSESEFPELTPSPAAPARSLRYLSPPRRQFPLRSKIQIDRIMGIREGRRDIDKKRGGREGGREGGAAWENVTRHDFLPLEIETSFLMIREEGSAASASPNPIDGLDVDRAGSHKIHCCMSGFAALSRCCAVPFSVPGPQISRCQINVICRQAAAVPITCTLVFITAALRRCIAT